MRVIVGLTIRRGDAGNFRTCWKHASTPTYLSNVHDFFCLARITQGYYNDYRSTGIFFPTPKTVLEKIKIQFTEIGRKNKTNRAKEEPKTRNPPESFVLCIVVCATRFFSILYIYKYSFGSRLSREHNTFVHSRVRRPYNSGVPPRQGFARDSRPS